MDVSIDLRRIRERELHRMDGDDLKKLYFDANPKPCGREKNRAEMIFEILEKEFPEH